MPNSMDMNIGLPSQNAPIPDYLGAANNHSVAAGIGNWFDDKMTAIGESISNAPKFWGLAAMSGAVGLGNSITTVANWLSPEDEQTELLAMDADMFDHDDDLGRYYRENKESIDLAGFIGSSMIPGLGGVKAFNLARGALSSAARGAVGANMSAATRILVPQTERYIAKSAERIAATSRTAGLLQKERLAAIGTRAWDGVLESAAFETAVLATNFKSPFLEDMETSDIVWNSLANVALGGILYGGLAIPGIRKSINQQVAVHDIAGMAGRRQIGLGKNAPSNAKVISAMEDKQAAQGFIADSEAKLAAGPQPGQALPTEAERGIVNKHVADAKNTVRDVDNQVRTFVRDMVPNGEIGNLFADVITSADPNVVKRMMLTAERMMRVGEQGGLVRARIKEIQRTLKAGKEIADDVRSAWYELYDASGGAKLLRTADGTDIKAMPTGLADRVRLTGVKDTLDKAITRLTRSMSHSYKRSVSILGKDAGNMDFVQSRYLAASRSTMRGDVVIDAGDIPYLERAVQRLREASVDDAKHVLKSVTIPAIGKARNVKFTDADSLWETVKHIKDEAIVTALKSKAKTAEPIEILAQRVNVHPDYINGVSNGARGDADYLGWQTIARGMGLAEHRLHDVFYKPRYMGVQNRATFEELGDAIRMDADLWVESLRKANEVSTDVATTAAVTDLYGKQFTMDGASGFKDLDNIMTQIPGARTISDMIAKTSRLGSRPGMFHFANGNYGSLENYFQTIGEVTKLLHEKASEKVGQALERAREILLHNEGVAAEFSTVSQLVRRNPGKYQYSPGFNGLMPKKGYEDIVAPIRFVHEDTGIVWQAHQTLADEMNAGYTKIRASQGMEHNVLPGDAYGMKPNLTRLKYYAFVVDPTITGTGRTTMIHAATARDLEAMISKIQTEFPEWQTITDSQSKGWHKAVGDYKYDKTLNDVTIDSSLASRGIMSNPLPRTQGSEVFKDLIDYHNRAFRTLNSEIINAKYEIPFRELEALSRASGKVDASRFVGITQLAEEAPNDPYIGYIKTALNISARNEFPLLSAANQYVDNVVTRAWNTAQNVINDARGVKPETLEAVNAVFEKHGFRPAYYDAATYLAANHAADQAILTRFVRAAGGFLSTTFLRMDPFNAIVNKLGSTALTSSELTHVMNAIKRGDAEAVGDLAKLAHITVPGTGDSILSPAKLIANAQARFFADMSGPNAGQLGALYKQWGLDTGIHKLVMDSLEAAAYPSGALNPRLLQRKATAMADTLEKWTGNKFMEHYNRFIAADIMHQVTDIAVRHGIISPREQMSYVAAFVKRTQVNYNASQRPGIFQGPIGMAMGLFQSYQFNLLQQLFRYVGDGSRKSIAMFMGLQGTFFGLNGVPGFQAINSYVSQMSGNPAGLDLTDALSDGTPAGVASFLLYGAPSNLLHGNLYSRGDATPQNPTVLPTNVGDLPMVNMYGRFFGNLKNTAQNVMNGADLWPAFLSGLEHNSINRPLSGIAQVLRGLTDGTGLASSYTATGKLISSNDLYSMATLARLGGGKPLDEAVARNEMFKLSSVRQSQRARLGRAAQALRVTMQGGGEPSESQMADVYDTFLQSGYKQKEFARWSMRQYLEANQSEVQRLQLNLGAPLSQRMQILLGGADVQ